LIETTERVTFEEDATGFACGMPVGFRATSVGAYHLRRWMGTFAYLDAMLFDTPIFHESAAQTISQNLESFDIGDRLLRATTFRAYLTSVWDTSGLGAAYFNWHEAVRVGEGTFGAVRWAVERIRRMGERPHTSKLKISRGLKP
jgi:hypothetical protein